MNNQSFQTEELVTKDVKALLIDLATWAPRATESLVESLNKLISEDTTHQIYLLKNRAEISKELSQRILRILRTSRSVKLITLQKGYGLLGFKREAWEVIGGFHPGTNSAEILREITERAKLQRRFATIELIAEPELTVKLAEDKVALLNSVPREARVLFFVPFGHWRIHNQVDAVLAAALRERGTEVCLVGCDGLFKNCYPIRGSYDQEASCRACAQSGKEFLSLFNLSLDQIRNYLAPNEIDEKILELQSWSAEQLLNYTHEGFPLGRRVGSSVGSYMRVIPDQYGRADVLEVYRKYLSYGIVVWQALDRLFKKFNPTHAVIMNGNGFIHSSAFGLSKARGVKIITHERGMYDGSLIIVKDDIAPAPQPYLDLVPPWQKVPLLTDEFKRIRQFYRNREVGKDLNAINFYEESAEHSEVRAKLGIEADSRILAVFTSSLYELAYFGEELSMVTRQFEILDRLIEDFRARKGSKDYLVIRHHPSMGTRLARGINAQYSMLERIYKQAAVAPSNVRIIMPDEDITSYSIAWNAVAAIAFFSTMRLEAAARGIPVASSNHPYLRLGVTHAIEDESQEGLHNLVESLYEKAKNFTVDDLRNIYRTSHAYFFKHSTLLRSVQIKQASEVTLNINDLAELRPGNDVVLDRICDHITKGTSIYDLPSTEHINRSDTEETELLKIELKEIEEFRSSLIKAKPPKVNSAVCLINYRTLATDAGNYSISRQRYTNHKLLEVSLSANSNFAEKLRLLRESIARTPHEYFGLCATGFYYDEAWLRSSIDVLNKETHLDGVLSPAWLRTNSNNLEGFFQPNSENLTSYVGLKKCYEAFRDPLLLLCFGLFQRKAIERLLNDVSQLLDEEQVGEVILRYLRGQTVKCCANPSISAVLMRNDGAIKLQERVKIVNTEMSPERLVQLINQAVDNLQANRNVEALKILREVVPLKSEMPDLLYAQAVAEARLGMVGEACLSLKTLLNRQPTHQSANNLLRDLQRN